MALAIVVGLVCVSVVVVVIARREPRGEVSQSLKFLVGMKPSKTTVAEQMVYDRSGRRMTSRTCTTIVEIFDLPKGGAEVQRLVVRENVDGMYVHVGHPDGDVSTQFPLKPDPRHYAAIAVIPLGPKKTRVEVTEELVEDPMRRFFAWVRRVTGGA